MRYSFSRLKTGRLGTPRNSRLSWTLVREIRRWSQREGYGLPRYRQIEHLRRSYPVSYQALDDILGNRSWHETSYEPGTPDHAFFHGQELTQLVLRAVALTRN